MKKLLIILVFLASFATLHSADYKFFTAKQGLPKAIEAAKQIGIDSLQLFYVYCSEDKWDVYGNLSPIETTSVNDKIGTALQWFYEFAKTVWDTSYSFKIKNDGNNFIVDSIFSNSYYNLQYFSPVNINDFIIDSDSLNKYSSTCRTYFEIVPLAKMFLCNDNGRWYYSSSYPVWESKYTDYNYGDNFEYGLVINASTGECVEYKVNVKDNNNEQNFEIKVIPNSDIITVHSNIEFVQNAVLRVFDLLGSLVNETKFTGQDYQISTASLSPGIYFVQLIYGNKIETKPVMVLH